MIRTQGTVVRLADLPEAKRPRTMVPDHLDFAAGPVDAAARERLEAPWRPPHVEEDAQAEPSLTVLQHRREVKAQVTEQRRRARSDRECFDGAWRSGTVTRQLALLDDASHAPPFEVHSSHLLVLCGGYSGCVHCGRIAGFWGQHKFARECRLFIPEGTLVHIRRLMRGLLPSSGRALGWPSGEVDPAPRRWRPPQSSSSHP